MQEGQSIVEVLTSSSQEVLTRWIALQHEAVKSTSTAAMEDQVRQQSVEFLTALTSAVKNGGGIAITGPAWTTVRELLARISSDRAVQGFSPSETATFVFSLKQPLFEQVRRRVSAADDLAQETWAVNKLLDGLGLLTMEEYQKTREDVISRQRAEAERANRFKDEFLATLSHELRTPLSAMVGWLWHLRSNIADERMRQRALDALERNTNLQVRLINDLLDVSRIGRDKVELEIAPVDLASVVESALDSVQTAVELKQIAVNVTTTPVAVMGDSARLQQVLVNLLTNAIKFSQQNGRVEITLSSNDDQAVIRVTDMGSGIDAGLLPRVFDQFKQGEGGFERRHSGLGIGLTIVRRLVAMHGGSVEAESKGPGLGATFTVRLPATKATAQQSPPLPKEAGQPLRGRRILVVDDDDNSRMWLYSVIEQGGGLVAAVESPHAALEYAGRHAFDLIVSDIGMPEIDGLALLKMLRAAGHQMPAVAVTAFSAAHEQQNILAAGYQAYFAKPIDPAAFITKLADLLAPESREIGN